MTRIAIIIFSIICAAAASAYTGTVVDGNGEPVMGAGVYGWTADSTYVNSAVTDSSGHFNLASDPRIAMLCVRSLGCLDVYLNPPPENAGTIRMTAKSHELNEVVVRHETIQHTADRTIVRLTKEQFNKYSTVLDAFNEIPHLFTNRDGTIYYKGNNNVTVLINSQAASSQEIAQLSKSDISRIEIYDIPPARYLIAGAACVIDVITKSDITGGNAGASLYDALWRVNGHNSAWATYNYKRSRFNVRYSNTIRHYRKFRMDESLNYTINGIDYGKTKTGKNSPQDNDEHSVSVGFMNRKAKDYQFNATASYSNNKNDNTTLQDVHYANGVRSNADNRLKTGYDNYSLDLYFNKTQKNGNEFMANVVGTGYHTDYSSHYLETLADNSKLFETSSQYTGHRHSVVAQLSYMLNTKIGLLYFGASGSYLHYRNRQHETIERGNRTTASAYAQYYIVKGKFYYSAMLAARYADHDNSGGRVPHEYSRIAFVPYASITYRPTSKISIQAAYNRDMKNPTSAQLSEYAQWIDANYMFHGNASLRPYTYDAFSLGYNHELPFMNIAFIAGYNRNTNYISNHFEYVGDNILETIVNLKHLDELTGQLDLTVFLLRNKSLYFHARTIGGRTWGKGENYNWKGYRFQFMPSLTLRLKKWKFEAAYQYPGKVVEGHLIRPRAECITLSGEFRPTANMTVGLTWRQPFSNSFSDGEHTVKESIVRTDFRTHIGDWGNLVQLSFVCNFDFGRKHDNSRQRLTSSDNDSGIYTK